MLILTLLGTALVLFGGAVGAWLTQRRAVAQLAPRSVELPPSPIDILSRAAHIAAQAHGASSGPWTFTIAYDGREETSLALKTGQYMTTPPSSSRLGRN